MADNWASREDIMREGDGSKRPWPLAFIVLGGVVAAAGAAVLIAVLVTGPRARKAKDAPVAAPQEPAEILDASQLLGVYDANEALGDSVYKGKFIEVSGVSGKVGKDLFGKAYLILKPGDREDRFRVGGVQCYFKDDRVLLEILPRDLCVVRGVCGGKSGFVLLRECELHKKTERQK